MYNKDNTLGVGHNNFIKHGRLADDYAGSSSVPVRRMQTIKSIYDKLSHPPFFLSGCFRKPELSPTVSLCRPYMYAGVTQELSIFPLIVRDMRLSPIISSTFLQAFTHVINLIITKRFI